MIIVNTDTIAGKEIVETLGLARGSTIQAKHIGKDIMSGLRHIVGGELVEYSKMLEESREKAINRMVADAESMGADAVINVRFMTSMIMSGAAEILAYGTAVKIKDRQS
ncbi:MAG TPA: YbjQ family protein [archaeon]|nr:YbjQ family protein [archaeon]